MTQDILFARVEDMLFRADRGEAVWSSFLNESERQQVTGYLAARSIDSVICFFGGYDGAERTRLFVYPGYYDFDEIKKCIVPIEIRGSGYEALKHSSYLGALTGLGIDRAKMGDIVLGDHSAVLFADEAIARFLLSDPAPLTKVGRDTVRVFEYELPSDFENTREFKEIFNTVASGRLDAVVSCLAGVSRDKAKGLCNEGFVSVNYLIKERPDTEVKGGDVVTIRSYGKFVIESLADKTKKERYKLIAKKYI